MEQTDLLRPSDSVKVTILGPENNNLYTATASGFHTIDEAIRMAIGNAGLQISPEDCVFEINNLSTGVDHSYRINAHGNLKLIV